jgi:hypothetical protein
LKRLLIFCLVLVACLVPANAFAGTVGFTTTPIATSPAPNDVAVGDLDGKNGPDIVVSAGEELKVMLNNGNGTFGAAQGYPTGCPTYQVELADVTTTGTDLPADGKLDAVVFCVKNSGDLKQIGRLAGNGAGGFGPNNISGLNPGYLSLNIYLDQSFALANLRAPGLPPVPVFSYSNGGYPKFETLLCYSYDWVNNECLTGGAGYPNIALPIIAGEVAQARVFTLGGEKGILDWGADTVWKWSTRELAPDFPSTAENFKSMTIGDLSGDGPDIISASGTCGCGYKDVPPAGVIDVLYGSTAIGVPDQVGTKFPSAPGVTNIATGDFDLDGHGDVIGNSWSANPATLATTNSVFVQTSNGAGGLEAPQMFPLAHTEFAASTRAPIRVADLDRNGSPDAVSIVSGQVVVLLNVKSAAKVAAQNALAGIKKLPKKVLVDKNGNVLLGSATNPPTASVDLTVLLPSGKAKGSAATSAKPKHGKKKKGVVIGHAKITIPAGKKRPLKVHLKPKALAKLKQGKTLKAKLTIVAVAVDGTKATKTQSLTIKPRKKAKKH